MFKKQIALTSLLCCLAGVVFAAPLRVLSAAPRGLDSASGRQAVTVTFNQPVTALAEATQFASGNCPLTITPNVAGTCRYSGTQTLQFEPAENWPQATQFTVTIRKGFTSRVSGQKLTSPYTFTFSTQTPQVRNVLPRNQERWINLTPTFYVEFTLPVEAEKLTNYAILADEEGNHIPLSSRALTEAEWEKDFKYTPKNQQAVLHPLQTLRPGQRYTLTFLKGLLSSSGPLGMKSAYTTEFFTYPLLAVQGVVSQGCLPFNPGIRFSSPVRLRELVASMKVSPENVLRPLAERETDYLGSEVVIPAGEKISEGQRANYQKNYGLTEEDLKQGTAFFFTPLSFLNLPAKKPVQVTISKELRDIYGNRLGQDYSFTIENTGYCPATEFSGGFGVLESYLPPRLPIEVMNVSSLPVRAARFNKANYVPFLQEETRYCEPHGLQHPTYEGNYTFTKILDKTLKTFFDLSRFQPTAQDSIIFTQVNLPRRGDDKHCWVSATSNITDVGVTLKTSFQSTLLWTTSLKTGEPLPGKEVELRDSLNKVLWRGITNEQGIALAPGWEKLGVKKPSWGQPAVYAFISSEGGDAFLSNELNDGMELWRFNVPYSYSPQQDTLRTELFTERGIYRPGETIYVKGVTRSLEVNGWTVPEGLTGKLTLTDSRGEEIASRPITLSRQGSFNTEFQIPQTARTGDWELSFVPQVKGDSDPIATYLSVRVEAVKQADFEITLHPSKQNYQGGETASFSAAALYNFGAPLAKAAAKWSLHREMAWFEPKGFEDYRFIPYFLRENEYQENGKQIASGTGKTDDQGTLSFAAPLPAVTMPTDIFAEVGVQSPAKQDLFARTSVRLHPASFYLGTKLLTDRAQAGQPVQAEVIAITPDGKRVAAQVVATIRKIQWYSVRKTGVSGRLEWVSEKQETELPAQSFEVSVAKDGKFEFTPQEGGNYQITFAAKDGNGRTALGGFDVYVSGEGETYWRQNEDDLLTLKQDKNSYKPGQKARIQVQSPYEQAFALVTVEREGILDAWVTLVKKGNSTIEVPIKDNYLPNVYVGVTLVRGRSAEPVNDKDLDLGKPQGRTGYVSLNVAPEKKKIQVSLKPNQTAFRPGDEVTLQLTTKAAGKPVSAEVTVMVVDEGMLALTNYKTPDLFSVFYRAVPLSVFTADNRSYVIGQRNFGEKGENRGGGGSSQSKLGGVDLRSHFSFVPYFNATVLTNAKGRGEVHFKLPDNLTKFRIMAVAARADEFGAAETFIRVSKPLMISANLPRLARSGDQFRCGAIVYNYEDKKGILTVSAQSAGPVELTGENTQTVYVPLGQAKEVTWNCKALRPGQAEIAFRVAGKGKETDGMLAKLPIEPVEKLQTLAVYGSTDSRREELIDKPGSVSPLAKNQVELSLASTALLQVKGALTYLLTYPFDCLEQQLSKSIPVITAENLIRDFELGDVADLKQKAQQVLEQMPLYQTPGGGFGYWKNTSLADPYVTAYALEVAYLAKQQGYHVAETNLKKAQTWLTEAFNAQARRAYTYSLQETEIARAYGTYVLALYGQNTDALFNNLYAKRNSLPLAAVAYLLKEAKVSKRATNLQTALAQQLLNRATYTPTSVYFSTPSSLEWLPVDDVTTTALALDALLETKQPFEHAYQSVSWLLTQLSAQGYWPSTQSNAVVLRALGSYYKQVEAVEPDFTAQVSQGEQVWQTAAFKGRHASAESQTVPFAKIYPQSTEARLVFAKKGAGTLYYSLAQVYAPEHYDHPIQAGFEVSRQLLTLAGEPVEHVHAGERYRITLTVRTSAPRHFVVLEDYVPAGLEIVNPSLATESGQLQHTLSDANAASYFTHAEKYDGHVAAFADYLPAGTYTYSYAVSALAAGEFAWPCAWVSEMYDPSVFGRNTTASLTIQ